jgi:hypothetical protein
VFRPRALRRHLPSLMTRDQYRLVDNDNRQLLALRHDLVRLHPAGDAMDRAAFPN